MAESHGGSRARPPARDVPGTHAVGNRDRLRAGHGGDDRLPLSLARRCYDDVAEVVVLLDGTSSARSSERPHVARPVRASGRGAAIRCTSSRTACTRSSRASRTSATVQWRVRYGSMRSQPGHRARRTAPHPVPRCRVARRSLLAPSSSCAPASRQWTRSTPGATIARFVRCNGLTCDAAPAGYVQKGLAYDAQHAPDGLYPYFAAAWSRDRGVPPAGGTPPLASGTQIGVHSTSTSAACTRS